MNQKIIAELEQTLQQITELKESVNAQLKKERLRPFLRAFLWLYLPFVVIFAVISALFIHFFKGG